MIGRFVSQVYVFFFFCISMPCHCICSSPHVWVVEDGKYVVSSVQFKSCSMGSGFSEVERVVMTNIFSRIG
jgi:hypothetical protein